MSLSVDRDYVLFSLSFFQTVRKNLIFFSVFSVFVLFFSHIFFAASSFSGADSDDDTIIVITVNCTVTALPVIVNGEAATAPRNTRVMRSETALFYYCTQRTLKRVTAQNIWHLLEMHVLSDSQTCWVCCCEQLICTVSENAQCIFCTAMSYFSRCKCSLIKTDQLMRHSDLSSTLWVSFFFVVFCSTFVSATY